MMQPKELLKDLEKGDRTKKYLRPNWSLNRGGTIRPRQGSDPMGRSQIISIPPRDMMARDFSDTNFINLKGPFSTIHIAPGQMVQGGNGDTYYNDGHTVTRITAEGRRSIVA